MRNALEEWRIPLHEIMYAYVCQFNGIQRDVSRKDENNGQKAEGSALLGKLNDTSSGFLLRERIRRPV